MGEFDTFGITLPVQDWRNLFELAERSDRSPSDYLRILIQREAARELESSTTSLTQETGAETEHVNSN